MLSALKNREITPRNFISQCEKLSPVQNRRVSDNLFSCSSIMKIIPLMEPIRVFASCADLIAFTTKSKLTVMNVKSQPTEIWSCEIPKSIFTPNLKLDSTGVVLFKLKICDENTKIYDEGKNTGKINSNICDLTLINGRIFKISTGYPATFTEWNYQGNEIRHIIFPTFNLSANMCWTYNSRYFTISYSAPEQGHQIYCFDLYKNAGNITTVNDQSDNYQGSITLTDNCLLYIRKPKSTNISSRLASLAIPNDIITSEIVLHNNPSWLQLIANNEYTVLLVWCGGGDQLHMYRNSDKKFRKIYDIRHNPSTNVTLCLIGSIVTLVINNSFTDKIKKLTVNLERVFACKRNIESTQEYTVREYNKAASHNVPSFHNGRFFFVDTNNQSLKIEDYQAAYRSLSPSPT